MADTDRAFHYLVSAFHCLTALRRRLMYQQITIVGNLGADPELRVRR